MKSVCPFVSFEPEEEVLVSILSSNPDTDIFCVYEEDRYDIHGVKSDLIHYININTLLLSSKLKQYRKGETFHEPMPTLEKLLFIDMLMLQYNIHEAFFVDSNTRVYFSGEYIQKDLQSNYRGIAAPYLGKGELSLSFLYIQRVDVFGQFLDWMLMNRYMKQPEAKIACMFWFSNRTDETDFLPSVSNECDVREEDSLFATNLGNEFRGVWDNGAYGMFVEDGHVSSTSSFSPAQFTYVWELCEDGIMRPHIQRHGNSWPLYTMVI